MFSSEACRLRAMHQPAKYSRLAAAHGIRVERGDAPSRLSAKYSVHRAPHDCCVRQPRNQDFPEF
jgi:hypothetical protein